MMQFLLDMFLRQFITVGRLTVRWPDGRTQIYAGRPGPEAGVILRDRGTVWRLILNPKLSVGEAYMDGGLVPLGGSIHDVLAVVLANLRTNPKRPLVTWLRRAAARVWRPIDQFNARARARRNVAHHYDLNGRLYSLFLDRDRQYIRFDSVVITGEKAPRDMSTGHGRSDRPSWEGQLTWKRRLSSESSSPSSLPISRGIAA
jgi:cyclopropane-fatty-acyl-phospholipid synthase